MSDVIAPVADTSSDNSIAREIAKQVVVTVASHAAALVVLTGVSFVVNKAVSRAKAKTVDSETTTVTE